jgi:putative endonuclease
MKVFSSVAQKTGELGEYIACRYFSERGFEIIERNYTKKWGEIDIIAKRDGVIHFIEVKSVSREILTPISSDGLRPEDQMHRRKQERLMRTIETYMASHEVGEWKFDLACVYVDAMNKKAHVKVIEDIILSSN